jgi:uncharacterized protein (DUF3084 family)
VSTDEVTVDVVMNRDVRKGEVISIELPNLSLSSSLVSSVQDPSSLLPEVEHHNKVARQLREVEETRHKMIEDKMRKSMDVWKKKMEEEREELMKEMKKAEQRLRKKAEDEVEHLKKELRDKLQHVAEICRRLEDKTDDVPSLPSPSQPSQDCHPHFTFISPPSPNIPLPDR